MEIPYYNNNKYIKSSEGLRKIPNVEENRLATLNLKTDFIQYFKRRSSNDKKDAPNRR